MPITNAESRRRAETAYVRPESRSDRQDVPTAVTDASVWVGNARATLLQSMLSVEDEACGLSEETRIECLATTIDLLDRVSALLQTISAESK